MKLLLVVTYPIFLLLSTLFPSGGSAIMSHENSITSSSDSVVTLKELFAEPSAYKDQSIIVKGKIVKVNNGIMNRNWIHLQDGSGENLDLTITTQEDITLNSIVTLKGKISLNVDFGAGYFYKIIMENATVQEEE